VPTTEPSRTGQAETSPVSHRKQEGPVESVWLPSGTLKVKGEAVCASLNRLPIEPCFNLNRTDDQSFRGSISGLDFAYCDFTRRLSLTDERPRPGPLSLRPTAW
jgi:hypothetical protein